MDLQAGAAWATSIAGFAVITFGFVLGWKDLKVRTEVNNRLGQAPPAGEERGAVQGGLDPAEYLKQLGELAKAMATLPQASQAFFIGTILWGFTTAIAIFDRVVG